MQLIASSELEVGEVEISFSKDGNPQHSIKYPSKKNPVQLLFNENNMPVFEVNAFILHNAINSSNKDTNQLSKALYLYYRFLKTNNNMKWDDLGHTENHLLPTFRFKSVMKKRVESGEYRDTTANAYMNIVKRFYMFCYRHGYYNREYHLPFTPYTTAYGKSSSDLSINVAKRNERLRPLSEYHLSLLIKNLQAVPVEVRLAFIITWFTGLRRCEVVTVRGKHLKFPKGFKGNTKTGIEISPSTGVHTKGLKSREIGCPVWLMKIISKYMSTQRYIKRKEIYYSVTGDTNVPLLLNRNGDIYQESDIDRFWSDMTMFIRDSDPSYKHKFYDLRATFGVARMEALLDAVIYTRDDDGNILSEGRNTQSNAKAILQSEMGHTHQSTTDLYLEYWENDPVEVDYANMMENMIEYVIKGLGII